MSDCEVETHKAVQALQDCIHPVLTALHSDRELTRQEHLLIHEAISKLQIALRYWEAKRPA